MNRGRTLGIAVVALVILLVLGVAASQFSHKALQEPSSIETYIAIKVKRWLVSRLAQEPFPPEPPPSENSIANGRMQYGGTCAVCHGQDGVTPTRLGNSLYPPTPSLASPQVQGYSNRELFVVIKYGIRNTGMAGFANIHSDEEIWNLVHYVRSLGEPSN